MILYLRGLIIGLLIFSWAMGYKFLSWDDNREFARNLAYATIRSAHIALCLLCYGWISKLALIDAVGAVLWGIFVGFFLLLIFSLCWISKEIDDEAYNNCVYIEEPEAAKNFVEALDKTKRRADNDQV